MRGFRDASGFSGGRGTVILGAVPQSSDKLRAQRVPVTLGSIQVDVTNRLGAPLPVTTTGLTTLDQWLLGGLRNGTLFVLTGAEGSGKTALSVLMAYMAARSQAASVFVSAALDEAEILSRLAARALFREYPELTTSYGEIWSGEAFGDDSRRGAIISAVNLAVRKIGTHLYFYRARPFETALEIGSSIGMIWGRHDRVVVFVDGVEALAASAGGDAARAAAANGSIETRLGLLGYELRHLAEGGCAVVVTASREAAAWLAPSATVLAELTSSNRSGDVDSARERALGIRGVDLLIRKNRLGKTGVLPLRHIAGGALFEERKLQGRP